MRADMTTGRGRFYRAAAGTVTEGLEPLGTEWTAVDSWGEDDVDGAPFALLWESADHDERLVIARARATGPTTVAVPGTAAAEVDFQRGEMVVELKHVPRTPWGRLADWLVTRWYRLRVRLGLRTEGPSELLYSWSGDIYDPVNGGKS